jgi:SAM-dependent methyltransferase
MSEEHYARIANLYDVFVTSDYDVSFFVAAAKKSGGEILELMAGTGRLTIPLLEAGIPVTGVDFSPEMLAVLRRKLVNRHLTAPLHQMDIRYLQLNRRFKQIIIPFQAFPELKRSDDQQFALERIHEHLDDDGMFICTLHNPPVRLKYVDNQLRLVGRHTLKGGEPIVPGGGGQLLVWLLQQRRPGTAIVEVHEFFEEYDADGFMLSRRYSSLEFHLLEKAEFEQQFQRAGFEVAQLYGDYQYAPFDTATSPFMIWFLRKKPR